MTTTTTNAPPPEARQGIVPENIQELLDAGVSARQDTLSNQNQYLTPTDLRDYCVKQLPTQTPATALDPQCGQGALVNGFTGYATRRYGIELDTRIESVMGVNLLTGNCVKVGEILDDAYPELRWVVINANCPFGKRWKRSDSTEIDSTEWTWKFALARGNCGYFIANKNTIERMKLHEHPWVYKYETRNDVWPTAAVVVGIIWWKRPPISASEHPTAAYHIDCAFTKIREILKEEKSRHSKWNIYLNERGYLKTYLSIRDATVLENRKRIQRHEILKLHRINDCHPLALTTEKESRDLLTQLIREGIYTIEPAAKAAIEQALAEVNKLACPIMGVTDFETVAYADEEDTLTCFAAGGLHFTPGRKYPIRTGTYRFVTEFKRNKIHFDEESQRTYTAQHDCTLTGQDRYLSVVDDKGVGHRFMDKPEPASDYQHPEPKLWEIFNKPVVNTVKDVLPEAIDQNLAVLRSCEKLCGYEYYPGQLEYLARVGVKDNGLIGAETGTGKTLMALSMIAMKAPRRCLIIAPQGTMRSSEDEDDEGTDFNASQWVTEINRFAPYLQIFELFSYADYQRLCSLNGGDLPAGVYVSYYQAMFQNGARESCPDTWDDKKLTEECRSITRCPTLPALHYTEDRKFYCDTLGYERNGIRCILQPCLSTIIGEKFDMVLVDEAHIVTNLDANVTQMLIRMQPKYRFALTATPIPNVVDNLFSLMGWLCVDSWYKGDLRNAAWPYSRSELHRFIETFRSVERDLTEEKRRQAADPRWRGKCTKASPVISSPARLLKLIKPTMAFISKKACNPNYKDAKVIDVRVPMGKEQAVLYGYYMNRANIPARHPLARARKQTAWLRGICADPKGFRHGTSATPKVKSNMNPKMIATLELVRDILAKHEQVLIISARVGFTDSLQDRLEEAGVPLARIDSTVSPEQHTHQANLFKSGRARVCLMGLKCAASHSFSQCTYEIITSLEYSPGSLTQARGRIDRVNSRPGVTIYCILHEHTIEEVIFDVVQVKDDAATICLRGQRVPRDFKPVSLSEVFATAFDNFTMTGAKPESECELKWPELQAAIRKAVRQ